MAIVPISPEESAAEAERLTDDGDQDTLSELQGLQAELVRRLQVEALGNLKSPQATRDYVTSLAVAVDKLVSLEGLH